MCTDARLNGILKRMVAYYKAIYGEDIEDIFLYGSYARGDHTEGSDIDIVAIVHGEREILQDKLKKLWDASAEVGLENDIVISPAVIPYDEYVKYKSTLPYYRNIAEEGRKIG
ncbi:MAG: nucleotidyltransferase domain-containing protein [Lachnospiraceae bacterium]|nr:nucleotidyltransferase domain-containing protein [Lachnospiraceae bacterium]